MTEENDGSHEMTWRVGVLFSQTGVTAAIERSQLNGTLLAVDEINKAGGVLGRPIEPNIYDPASNPKQFRALAERLLTADRVRLIFGCYMSSTRKAVLPVVEAFPRLVVLSDPLRGLRIFFALHLYGRGPQSKFPAIGQVFAAALRQPLSADRLELYLPYESNRVMADFITQSKGKVLDELLCSARCPGQGLQQGDQQDRSAQARRGVFDRRRPVDRRVL